MYHMLANKGRLPYFCHRQHSDRRALRSQDPYRSGVSPCRTPLELQQLAPKLKQFKSPLAESLHRSPLPVARFPAYKSFAVHNSIFLSLVMAPPNPCNSGSLLDFRSDTVTRPTPTMRQAAFEVWHRCTNTM